MPKHDSLLITPHYSVADRLLLVVAKFFYLAIIFSVVISLGYALWIGWAFSAQLRALLDSLGWSILIYLTVTALILVLGYFVSKLTPRLVLGAATFGQLGGMPRRTLSAAIRASAQISVDLFDHDQPLAVRFNTVQVRVLHDTLRANFEALSQRLGKDAASIAAEWPRVWDQQVLNMTFAGQSLREAMDVNKFGVNYAISALVRSTYAFPFAVNVFWIVMVYLIYRYANGQLALLTCVQAGVVMVFIMASFWYLFVLHNLTAFPMTFAGLPMPETTRQEFAKDIAELEGTELRPKHIQVQGKFYQIIRNYQTRLLCGSMMSDTSILLLLIGLIYGAITLIDADHARAVSHYHAVLAYGVIIAAAGIVASFYVFSVILQHFRKIGAALLVALLSAGLPFLIDYLLGGDLNISGVREAIFAGSGGLTVALVTAVTSNVKESME